MRASSSRPQEPQLFIDESLADRPLAQALYLVDYNAVALKDRLGEGAEDPTLIQWLGLQGGIWVTTDEAAKRKHAEEIKRAGIHIVWVQRHKKEGMSKRAQLLLLLWVLDSIIDEITRARGPTQFLCRYAGKRPTWARL